MPANAHIITSITAGAPTRASAMATAWRFALRALRGGLRGFGVFIACIILGVAAIAGVNSVSRALVTGLTDEGSTILGGDIALSLIHREASDEDLRAFARLGRVSRAAAMRGMARAPFGAAQTLVEIKAVDEAYPLLGAIELSPQSDKQGLATKGRGHGVWVEQGLLDRLHLALGDYLALGTGMFQVRGVILREPDRLAGGVGFGPRVMMSTAGLASSGLVQPGSLVRNLYRIALESDQSNAALAPMIERLEREFGPAGYQITSRANAAPGLKSRIGLFTQFLTLVGLTALLVGGVGIANAVKSHLDGQRSTIATLKALGASNGFVTKVYLFQIGIIAAGATTAGVLLGALAPYGASALTEMVLPIRVPTTGIYPTQLLAAALFSLATALTFALWPLGRIHQVPVRAIFRDEITPSHRSPPLLFVLLTIGMGLALVATVMILANDKAIAAIFLVAMGASFALLWAIGRVVIWLVARIGRPRNAIIRLALTNIHRPGALTGSIVVSLGLGLTLLVSIALIDSNLRHQLNTSLPARAPNFFLVDVPRDSMAGLRRTIETVAPGSDIQEVPMLRGRFITLAGQTPQSLDAPPNAQWALRGDRGITYSASLPANSKIVSGAWWAEDYQGPPLVSFEHELATAFGLNLGDKIEVNVLGRTIVATIANTRAVEWESLGINFIMVFSPNTFAGAPHMMLATVALHDDIPAAGDKALEQANQGTEHALAQAVARDYPTVTSVRIKDALNAINGLVGKLAWAVRAASAIALIAAILVLTGALAASHHHRIADAVILKMLGARRAQLLMAYALEFTLIGIITGVFALLSGSAIAWLVITQMMHIAFAPAWIAASLSIAGALLATVLIGLIGTRQALAGRPAQVLRDL